jgi:hypothetical protein
VHCIIEQGYTFPLLFIDEDLALASETATANLNKMAINQTIFRSFSTSSVHKPSIFQNLTIELIVISSMTSFPNFLDVRTQVLTAVLILRSSGTFGRWIPTFRGTYCLHRILKFEAEVASQRWFLSTKLHDVTFQNLVISFLTSCSCSSALRIQLFQSSKVT